MPVIITTDAVRSRWVRAGGVDLHQLDWGGGGRPVLCLHGVTSCSWVWHHVARHLTASHRVLAGDLRGHGESSWAPPDAYGTTAHAADVVAVIDDLVGGPVDLVGSSWGALIALAVASERPELVGRLVLVDIEPSSASGAADVPRRPRRFSDVVAAGDWWRSTNPHAPSELVGLLGAVATVQGPGGSRFPRHDPVFFSLWPFRSEDWWPALGQVKAPTLVIRAGQSWVRAEICDEMAAQLARAERLDLPDAGHVVPVDAPDALGAALARYLGGRP
ncbi:MAG: alpha/beta hydrolase [Actinomycetota bacterium]|nr:alpha/beta hydrolase [Actinomycetota bacterium]